MERICLRCKKEFEATGNNQKYCGRNCQRNIWDKNNHKKVLGARKKYRDKHKNDEDVKIKGKARQVTRNFKRDICKICGTKVDLEFHHTNYKTYEGFVACRKCHKSIHLRRSR